MSNLQNVLKNHSLLVRFISICPLIEIGITFKLYSNEMVFSHKNDSNKVMQINVFSLKNTSTNPSKIKLEEATIEDQSPNVDIKKRSNSKLMKYNSLSNGVYIPMLHIKSTGY